MSGSSRPRPLRRALDKFVELYPLDPTLFAILSVIVDDLDQLRGQLETIAAGKPK